MPKVLVVSDSHLEQDIFNAVTKKYQSLEYKIHCGDSSLPFNDSSLQGYITVLGNHDDDPHFETKRFVKIGDYRCLVLHGHLQKVYYGYDAIIEEAKKMKCSIVFHGHTHIPHIETIDGITCINPGSLMFNRGSYGYGTYCLVDLTDHIECHWYHHQTHEEVTDFVLAEGNELLQEFKSLKH